jgi:hypothetical protein
LKDVCRLEKGTDGIGQKLSRMPGGERIILFGPYGNGGRHVLAHPGFCLA